jgi:hypothetical protein
MNFAKPTTTLICTALVALAGCGGGDDEFTADVGAACTDAREKFAEANQNILFSGNKKKNEENFREANQPVYDEFLASLEAIEPPDDLSEDYDAYIAAIRGQSEVLLEDPVGIDSALLADRETAATRKLEELNAESERLSAELELPSSCVSTTGGGESKEAGG